MHKTMWRARPSSNALFNAYREEFSQLFETEEQAWDWWDVAQDEGWPQDDGIYAVKVMPTKVRIPKESKNKND